MLNVEYGFNIVTAIPFIAVPIVKPFRLKSRCITDAPALTLEKALREELHQPEVAKLSETLGELQLPV